MLELKELQQVRDKIGMQLKIHRLSAKVNEYLLDQVNKTIAELEQLEKNKKKASKSAGKTA